MGPERLTGNGGPALSWDQGRWDSYASVVLAYEAFSAGQRSSGRITRSPFPSCTESLSKSRRTPSGTGVSFAASQSASIVRAALNSAASINSSAERAWSNVNRPPNRMMRPRRRPVRSACVAKSKTRQSCAPESRGHAPPRVTARLERNDCESGAPLSAGRSFGAARWQRRRHLRIGAPARPRRGSRGRGRARSLRGDGARLAG
jgi:hypothetical protein